MHFYIVISSFEVQHFIYRNDLDLVSIFNDDTVILNRVLGYRFQ